MNGAQRKFAHNAGCTYTDFNIRLVGQFERSTTIQRTKGGLAHLIERLLFLVAFVSFAVALR